MRRRKFTNPERRVIEERAQRHCEYCLSPLDFSPATFDIEHIMPLSKGGSNELENLALSCSGCNVRKRNHIEWTDFSIGITSKLFHPRLDKWTDHFFFDEQYLHIIGRSDKGTVTLALLELNRNGLVNLRKALQLLAAFPPPFIKQ